MIFWGTLKLRSWLEFKQVDKREKCQFRGWWLILGLVAAEGHVKLSIWFSNMKLGPHSSKESGDSLEITPWHSTWIDAWHWIAVLLFFSGVPVCDFPPFLLGLHSSLFFSSCSVRCFPVIHETFTLNPSTIGHYAWNLKYGQIQAYGPNNPTPFDLL